MTHLKILTTAAALLVSLAITPASAQIAPFYGPGGELGYGPAPYYGGSYYAQNWAPNYTPYYYGQPWTPYYYGQNWTYDNSGWNGYNNGGYNNSWFDGRTYRYGPEPLGEDIAADATGAPYGSYGGSYAMMGDDEGAGVSRASCEQRYKSFNPATGTYRGRDGKRHICR